MARLIIELSSRYDFICLKGARLVNVPGLSKHGFRFRLKLALLRMTSHVYVADF